MICSYTRVCLAIMALGSGLARAQVAEVAQDPDHACAQAFLAQRFQPMAAAYLAGRRLPGVVVAARMQSIAAPDAAEVETLLVRPGATVVAGQALIKLRAPDLILQLEAAESERQQAAQEQIKQREELRRIELSLNRRQQHPTLFARDELDALAASAVAAKAALTQAEARFSLSTRTWQDWQRRLDALTIRAPADGQIASFSVRPGMRVGSGFELVQWHGEHGGNEIRFAMPIARSSLHAQTWCAALTDVGTVRALTSVHAESERWPSAEVQLMSARTLAALDWPQGAGVDVFPVTAEAKP